MAVSHHVQAGTWNEVHTTVKMPYLRVSLKHKYPDIPDASVIVVGRRAWSVTSESVNPDSTAEVGASRGKSNDGESVTGVQ